MKCTPEIHPETLEYLARLRTFIVQPCQHIPDFDERVPAHAKVIRPLLSAASEAFLWPPGNKQRTVQYPAEILSRERGRYRFDLSRDILTGYERLWHAVSWARGSIALRLPRLPNNFIEILMHCSCTPPAVLSSRYQLATGDSAGAIERIRRCTVVNRGSHWQRMAAIFLCTF